MADAAQAEETHTTPQLVRMVRAELEIAERRSPDCFIRIGGYLIALKLLNKGKWDKFLHDNFPFSETSANRYMKAYREAAANRKPKRLSDVDPSLKHNPGHHRASFRAAADEAWKAKQYRAQNPPPREPARAADADRAYTRELGERLIATGFRVLAHELHPDHKAGDGNRDMRCLTAARERLRACLRTW